MQSVRLECGETMRLTVGATTVTGRDFTAKTSDGQISVTGPEGDARGARIVVEASAPIRVDGTGYRGSIELSLHQEGITAVNVVGIEDYLRGVVPREIGYLTARELEAMKAQALAARTYSISHLGRRSARGFDLYADTRDQVYGGVAGECEWGDKAVDATAGRVITFHGRFIEAYYHSTCGGSTANIEDVWESPPVPYLRRVYDADDAGFYCQESRHFRWIETYTRDQLQEIVAGHLAEGVKDCPQRIGRLQDVAIESQAEDGRSIAVRFTTDAGSWIVDRQKIRQVLRRPIEGTPILRSSYVRMACDRAADGTLVRLTVSGGGNGHGIGLCQWGAIGMSRKGYTADQIVKHYYKGVDIVDYRASQVAIGKIR